MSKELCVSRRISDLFLYIIPAIFFAYLLFQFIKSYRSDRNKQEVYSKCIFISTIVFGLSCILWLFGGAIGSCFDIDCSDPSNTVTVLFWFTLLPALYVLQNIFILALLFYRLCSIFNDTQFELSQRTILAYWILYICTILMAVVGVIHMSTGYAQSILVYIIFPLVFICYISLYVMLIVLFVNKLMKVCANVEGDNNNHRIVSTATRAFVLTLASIISTTLDAVIVSIYPYLRDSFSEQVASWLLGLAGKLDTYTNFLSIYLSIRLFAHLYMKSCGCCDTKCTSLFMATSKRNQTSDGVDSNIEMSSQET